MVVDEGRKEGRKRRVSRSLVGLPPHTTMSALCIALAKKVKEEKKE